VSLGTFSRKRGGSLGRDGRGVVLERPSPPRNFLARNQMPVGTADPDTTYCLKVFPNPYCQSRQFVLMVLSLPPVCMGAAGWCMEKAAGPRQPRRRFTRGISQPAIAKARRADFYLMMAAATQARRRAGSAEDDDRATPATIHTAGFEPIEDQLEMSPRYAGRMVTDQDRARMWLGRCAFPPRRSRHVDDG